MSNLALLPGLLLVGAGIGWTVVYQDRVPDDSAEARLVLAPESTPIRQMPIYETGAALNIDRLEALSACRQSTCAGCDLDFKSLVSKWGPPTREDTDSDAILLDLR